MKKKNCKLTSILRAIALPLVGSAGGWLYYRYVGCATGTCAVTSSPWLSTGFGCILGSRCIPSCGPAAAGGGTATGRSDPCSP